jgi:hypothetical protein
MPVPKRSAPLFPQSLHDEPDVGDGVPKVDQRHPGIVPRHGEADPEVR